MEHKNVADYIKTFGIKLISDVLTFGLGSIYIYNNLNSSFFSRDYTIYFPLHNTYTNVINALYIYILEHFLSFFWYALH